MAKPARKASVVYLEILGGKKYSLVYYVKHLFEETLEIFEALFNAEYREAILETQQVIFVLEMLFHQATKIDFELKGCSQAVNEFYARREIWLEIFSLFDVAFKPEYLDGGSNFRRPYKIKEALRRAGVYVRDLHARSLSRKYSMQLAAKKSYDFSREN